MNKLKYGSLFLLAGMIAVGVTVAIPAFAQAQGNAQFNASTSWGGGRMGMHGRGPGGMFGGGIFGTVDSTSGTTLTVTQKMPPQASGSASGTVYTVDASAAQIFKNGASSTISSVAVGDTVMVQGTVSGTDVTAKVIRDGVPVMQSGKGFGGSGLSGRRASSTAPTPIIQGNGEPVVAGKVTNVSGTTITATNASNVTYTIDASSAKVIVNGTTTTASNITVGDNLIVQGVVNGTAVTASSIIDQGAPQANAASSSPNGMSVHAGGMFGIFGSIGGFFKKIFGF